MQSFPITMTNNYYKVNIIWAVKQNSRMSVKLYLHSAGKEAKAQ